MVSLAAAIAMLQANLLMNLVGRASDSFIKLDLMRLPLGILSGIGFIGAGAIVRKDDRVTGVTTAATLWFVTVMGLCFGGGQIGLGIAALLLALGTLSILKWVEDRIPQDRFATFIVQVSDEGMDEAAIQSRIRDSGFRIVSSSLEISLPGRFCEHKIRVHWTAPARLPQLPPPLIQEFAQAPGILKVQWQP